VDHVGVEVLLVEQVVEVEEVGLLPEGEQPRPEDESGQDERDLVVPLLDPPNFCAGACHAASCFSCLLNQASTRRRSRVELEC
jgi:hypothetical protein